MAINTICSSPTRTLSLSLSPLPSPPSSKIHQSLSTVSPKFPSISISNDASEVEAVALALAAVQAAREAARASAGTGDAWEGNRSNGLGGRRKRRRKRRKGFVEERGGEDEKVGFGSVKAGYLSPKEEAEICLCLKEGARLEAARRKMAESQEHEPTVKQWAKVMGMKGRNIDEVLCNGTESREKIIRSYRGLIVSIASAYQGKGLSLQDLVQEGRIGLLRGAERFDPERGCKLSTFVYWWIRQAVVRAVANKSRVVRLPGNMCEMVAKIAKVNNVLGKRLRRVPTYDEIAEALNVHASTVRLVSERNRPPISLDRAVSDRGCMTLQDIIPGPGETMPEMMVKRQLLKLEVEKLLKTLSEREAHILRLRFGLNGETPRSCEEIGRLLKLSRERIRQINGNALMKLRQTSNLDSLKMYIA